MPGGRPRKPAEEKRRLGNPGKRALPTQGNVVLMPAVPTDAADMPPADAMSYVLEHGRSWLGQTDSVAVALLREALEERAEIRAAARAGSTEARKALREIDKQIIGQLSALGFDPAARARLGLAEVKAASKLEELRRARTKDS